MDMDIMSLAKSYSESMEGNCGHALVSLCLSVHSLNELLKSLPMVDQKD